MAILLLLPSFGQASHLGIGGEQDKDGDGNTDISDVAKEGCLCHADNATNSVQIILDDVPYTWVSGLTYAMKLQVIGGPDIDSSSYTAGFSIRTSAGTFTAGTNTQNWEDDTSTLTHNDAGSNTPTRMWNVEWTAPSESDIGHIDFWITGNSVNGDMAPGIDDQWNQLFFNLAESEQESGLGTRTLFAGDGNVEAPIPEEHGVHLHEMGAKLRAHWLGLLGFLSVILVIIFAGFMLRYGFSSSYEGRSNLVRLRYKIKRRGDQ